MWRASTLAMMLVTSVMVVVTVHAALVALRTDDVVRDSLADAADADFRAFLLRVFLPSIFYFLLLR